MSDNLHEELERNIPLSEMIESLRIELLNSMSKAKNSELRFKVDSVELELQMVIEREKEGELGLKFWVVNAGGKGKKKDQQVHTFRLKLTPRVGSEKRDLEVADETGGSKTVR